MICKYCQSKIDDYGICPVCGAENPAPEFVPEEAFEKKVSHTGTIICIAIAAAVLIAAVVLLLGWKCFGWFDKSAEADTPSFSYDMEGFGTTTVAEKASYATTTAVAGSEEMATPVVLVNDQPTSNATFNVYFWMEYYNFMNSYGAYASYFGLDSSLPLNEQQSMAPLDPDDENSPMMTWEQYFLDAAVKSFTLHTGLALAAEKGGYQLPADMQAELDAIPENLLSEAVSQGYATADEMVAFMFGSGVSLEDYRSYLSTFYMASSYYSEYLAAQVAPSDADVEAYYDENVETYASLPKVNNVSVRHILLAPEQDLDSDGDGVMDASSDDAWAAAKALADEVYAQWQADPTEDRFAELANENSTDPGSNTTGGLYEDFAPGQMVAAFNDWCFDSARQPGDTGIVETDFGYHIMFFIGSTDTRSWFDTAKADMTNQLLSELAEEKTAPFADSIKFNYRNILICDLITANAQAEAEG